MNFSVDFCENAERFSAQFHEDDQSFDAFGKGVVLVNGKDGGYYTPDVTQPNSNTLSFGFTPSESDMPEVPKVEVVLPSGSGGGTSFKTDETLTLKNGVLGVNTADEVGASTLPVTAAAVDTVVGNIEVLLGTI